MPDIESLLKAMVTDDATDLHLKVGSTPMIRVGGELRPVGSSPVEAAEVADLARSIMPASRKDDFDRVGECDFAHSVAGLGRFRVNVHRQRGSVGMVVRHVPSGNPRLEELGLPSAVTDIASEPNGLVLVTGPRGSGTSTTAAALVDHVNEHRAASIVTIEDPIEVLHQDKRGIVSQREIGTDTPSYAEGLRRAVNHDADVIYVQEIHDRDVAAAAIGAAESGQLVISTMTTSYAQQTVLRLVDFFPPYLQRQMRHALAATLRGIISQRLVERADAPGKVVAAEILVGTPKVVDLIAEPDSGEPGLDGQKQTLLDVMAEGRYSGMQTLDQALLELLSKRLIDVRTAMENATDPQELRISIQAAGLDAGPPL